MRPYLANIRINLKLTMRDRMVLFFNFAFPLVFFFIFGQIFGRGDASGITQVISMVLILGVLGTGLFGAGLRAVQEREQNILRRFKVAPISAAPLLVASLVTGWVTYLPSALLFILLGHFQYGMPIPAQPFSLFAILSLGVIAFRAVGLVIASVVNSMQESQVLVQLLYLPMLFLSGATFPLGLLPNWLQIAAQFLPATYLNTGITAILVRNESLAENAWPATALALTTAVSMFISTKLFRWEKEEKISASAKLWLLAVFAPFAVLGVWQAQSKETINKSKALTRDIQRIRTTFIRNARVFDDSGSARAASLLIRNGKIEEIYATEPAKSVYEKAAVIEGAGKTVLPALADHLVELTDPAAPAGPWKRDDVRRALAAYLFSGITSVAVLEDGDKFAAEARQGERLLPEITVTGATAGFVRVTSAEELAKRVADARVIDISGVREAIPAAVLRDVSKSGVALLPALVSVEASEQAVKGAPELLERGLIQQVMARPRLEALRRLVQSRKLKPAVEQANLGVASVNLRLASAEGVRLVMGTGSGRPLVPHGPAIHRELQLWTAAGVPAPVALRAATGGLVLRKGGAATLLVVDGNPLADISATERVSAVFLKGERVPRSTLFEEYDEDAK
ncbi:MAG: ABC transporter permease [Bryobacteraceae bacterium]|nr:ABC transporter permease [Bryobacteraceae bacterium]